jgi:hypothetical protein
LYLGFVFGICIWDFVLGFCIKLTAITGASNLRNLPLNLSTSLAGKPPVPGTATAVPKDTDIKWSGSEGEPVFSPSSGGSSVEIDFTRPFVKTTGDAATTLTASYSPSASSSSSPGSECPPPSVSPSSQTKDLDRIYLDFWVADTEDTKDDIILVHPTTSQLEAGQKTVLHWAKVTVKHNRGKALKLKIENSTSSGKPLYFLDQEEDPNPQTKDPALTSELEKEFDEGKFFWVGSAEKGEGEGKFKVQGDLGSGYKDAPEEKTVKLVPFDIEKASIREGQFVINVPNISNGATGTLDLIIRRQGSTTEEVILKTWTNQAPGKVTISLDEIMNHDQSPLDDHDATRYDRVVARWRVGTVDVKSGDKNLDVNAVEALNLRRISNYFSPTWGGTWGGNAIQKGFYAAGNFPNGLQNVTRQTEFLNALDPQNEGLAMDGDIVVRDQIRPAQVGFNRVIYLNGSQGYIEKPDRDQDNAASPNVQLLRAASVAVRTDADRLHYNDEIYIPDFSIRSVDDSGTLHGNKDQIDVWRGQGDQVLQTTVDNFGLKRRTCLKIITP